MNQTLIPKHFRIVHELKQRIRIAVPCLRQNTEQADHFKAQLYHHDAIGSIRIVTKIAAVIIVFDSVRLPRAQLYTLLDELLDTFTHEKTLETAFPALSTPAYRQTHIVKALILKERQALQASKRECLIAGLLSLPVIGIALLCPQSRFRHWLQFILTTSVVFNGGKNIFSHAHQQFKQHGYNTDSLISLSAGAAYGYSLPALFWPKKVVYFEVTATLISLTLLGRYIEQQTNSQTHESVHQLIDPQPQMVTLVRNNNEMTITHQAVLKGDELLLRPGDIIPADGTVISGTSRVDESLLHGTSIAVVKTTGDCLTEGCFNISGELHMHVTATKVDTRLAEITRRIKPGSMMQPSLPAMVERMPAFWMPWVITGAIASLMGGILAGIGISRAFAQAVSVLLIACPAVLSLVNPITFRVTNRVAVKQGIYIRNRKSLETVKQLSVIVFDKTGTLTEGKPYVTELINISAIPNERIAVWAASAELHSTHCFGQAIVNYARNQRWTLMESQQFDNQFGYGIRSSVDNQEILLGSQTWIEAQGIQLSALYEPATDLAKAGQVAVFVAVNGRATALFSLADSPRKSSRQAIQHLHQRGIKTLLVTGDSQATADTVSALFDISEIRAESSPEDKLDIITELQAQGHVVGMVGDGMNDALVLAAADVGFSLGTASDLALEAADINLVSGDIAQIADILTLSETSQYAIRQNLFWAFLYNGLALPVAVLGKLNSQITAGAMMLSAASVIVNSVYFKDKNEKYVNTLDSADSS